MSSGKCWLIFFIVVILGVIGGASHKNTICIVLVVVVPTLGVLWCIFKDLKRSGPSHVLSSFFSPKPRPTLATPSPITNEGVGGLPTPPAPAQMSSLRMSYIDGNGAQQNLEYGGFQGVPIQEPAPSQPLYRSSPGVHTAPLVYPQTWPYGFNSGGVDANFGGLSGWEGQAPMLPVSAQTLVHHSSSMDGADGAGSWYSAGSPRTTEFVPMHQQDGRD